MRLLGVLSTGEAPSAQEQSDALASLNDMLEDWSNQNLLIPSKLSETFSLVSGQGTYAMGPMGDFDTVRPQKIENANLVLQASPQLVRPMKLINQDQFANIRLTTLQSTIPKYLYFDAAFPLANINIWPIPSAAMQIILYSWKPLSTFSSASIDVSLPQGYPRALSYNLALEIAPEYGKNPSDLVATQAVESKAWIKRLNRRPSYMSIDKGLLGPRKVIDWRTGE